MDETVNATDTPSCPITQKDIVQNNVQHGTPSHYVVVGVHTDDLDTLTTFLGATPNDTGFAFIIVVHAKPKQAGGTTIDPAENHPPIESTTDPSTNPLSHVAKLISTKTQMPLEIILDTLVAEANTVYLGAQYHNLSLHKGRFKLVPCYDSKAAAYPIDVFCRRVAQDQQHQCLGVLLSPNEVDGWTGAGLIQELGGVVAVVSPENSPSSKHPNLKTRPNYVTADHVTRYLIDYIQRPFDWLQQCAAQSKLKHTKHLLEQLFQLLKQEDRLDYGQYKSSYTARRIERRARLLNICNLKQYVSQLKHSQAERRALANDLLNSDTRFFRNWPAFDIIKQRIVPHLLTETPADRPLRVWIVGCSTGEEAYSVATLFHQALNKDVHTRAVKIFATDIKTQLVNKAAAGIYPKQIEQDIPASVLTHYFTEHSGNLHILNEVRTMVTFSTHNVISDPPFSNIDLVCCRNLLGCFQNATQQKILSALYFSMNKHAYLFLGPDESVSDLHDHFHTIDHSANIHGKLADLDTPLGVAPPFKSAATDTPMGVGMQPVTHLLRSHKGYAGDRSPLNVVKDTLVSRLVPPSVVINHRFEVQHVFGDVSRFMRALPEGPVTNDISSLVVRDLVMPITSALAAINHQQSNIYYTNLALNDGESLQLDLEVISILADGPRSTPEQQYYVIMFHSQQDQNIVLHKQHYDLAEQYQQRIASLEHQVRETEEHLKITIEELEATNEELQSANEELMSANEELQSTNEELYTVNAEHQLKLDNLTRTHEDFTEIIDFIDTGYLLLDETLKVKRYTAPICNYINLHDQQLGKPFENARVYFDYKDFHEDIRLVLKTKRSKRKQVPVRSVEIAHQPNEKLLNIQITPLSRTHGQIAKTDLLISIHTKLP